MRECACVRVLHVCAGVQYRKKRSTIDYNVIIVPPVHTCMYDFGTGVYPLYFKNTDKQTNKKTKTEKHINAGILTFQVSTGGFNPIHPIGNSLKKQKPCTKTSI